MRPLMLSGEEMVVFLVIVGAGLAIFYSYVYRQEARNAQQLGTGKLWSLRAIRIVAALMVLLALARPAFTLVKTEERMPVVAMLVDESLSMGFPGSRDNDLIRNNPASRRTRFDGAQEAVGKLQERLGLTHDVKVYTFSEASKLLRSIPHRESEEEPPMPKEKVFEGQEKPTGEYTNVGDGVTDVMRDLSANKISGLIMMSDFRETGGEALKKVAERAKAAKVPLHSVAFGTEFPLRDLRIDEVIVPPESSLGDVLIFNVKVTNQIRSNLEVKLKLYEQGKVINERQLELKRGPSDIKMLTIPSKEGMLEYKLELEKQPDEVDYENNVQVVQVKIVKRTIDVLLVTSVPTFEYFYMVPALLRDPVVRLSCWLQSGDVDYIHQGNANIKKLPESFDDWKRFDVVILYDVDPKNITPQQVNHVEDMVEQGGGLMVIGGRNEGLAKLLQVHGAKLEPMLPVEIGSDQLPNWEKVWNKPFMVERTPMGKSSPILWLSQSEALNEGLWKTFPKFYWHHPVRGTAPGAITLMERSGPKGERGKVLMALSRYGKGSVFFTGLNELWRWRYPHESFDYDRLWTKIIRYLGATKLTGGQQQQVSFNTDRQSYSPGEEAQMNLRVLDPALWQQLEGQAVYAKIVSRKYKYETNVKLRPDTEGAMAFRGRYTVRHIGSMVAEVKQMPPNATTDDKPLFEVQTAFQVKMQSLEFVDTSADLDTARLVSEQTDGKYFDYRNMGELMTLAQTIPPDPQVLTEKVQVEIWDGMIFVLIFVALVSVELCLRKLWGLL